MKKDTLIIIIIILSVLAVIVGFVGFCFWLFGGKLSTTGLDISSSEIIFLTNNGFLESKDTNINSSYLKPPDLIEQNLNSNNESFKVLATKLNNANYQMAFKLENKTEQEKEFYLIPVSKESQLQFEEIKGIIDNKNTIAFGKKDASKEPLEQLYDVEKHKKELNPELAKAYEDIKGNGYSAKPIKITLPSKSIFLAQSDWKVSREISGGPTPANSKPVDSATGLEPVYLLVYGSAGGAKDDLVILNVHSHPQQGENWEVSFTTNGKADLKIIPNDQATIDDDEFVSLFCDNEERTPQILQGDVIYYPNWECLGTGKVIHYTKKAGKHTLRFEFNGQTAFAYNSIVKEQQVSMADGSQKNIEDVKVGDEIISYNPDTKTIEKDKVIEILKSSHNEYLVLNNTLKISLDHSIFANNEFIPAQDIKVGDILLNSQGNSVIVSQIDHIYDEVETYDIVVQKNRDFFANGFLVHNITGYTWQNNWRIYYDDGAEPVAPYANENTIATLSSNNVIVRIRVDMRRDINAEQLNNFKIQYSIDNTNFTDMGAGNAWNWANGQGIDGSTVASFLLSNTTTKKIYVESSANSPTVSSSSYNEFDFSITPTATVSASTLYYFRFYANNIKPVDPGKTHPQITTAAASASAPVTNQKHFRIYNDDGSTINNATALAGEDTNYIVPVDTNFRIRFEVANTGTAAVDIVRRLEFREYSGGSWGAWTQITTNSNNVRLQASANFVDGDATTSRLTATGTFTAGQGKDTGSDTSSISLTNGYYVEDEYSLKFQTGASGNYYEFRITNAGVALDSYTKTPSTVPAVLQVKGNLHVKGGFKVFAPASSPLTETLRPISNGSQAQIDNVVSPSGFHYDAVDDSTPDEDSSYLYPAGASCATPERDLYTIGTNIISSGTINSVKVYARMKSNAAGPYGKISIRTNSTTYDTSAYSLTTSYADYSNTWATNPNTSVAWTWSEINALEAGIVLYANSTFPCGGSLYAGRATQVYVEVNYTP